MHQIDVDIKKTDRYLRLKKAEGQQLSDLVAKVKGGQGEGEQQANAAAGMEGNKLTSEQLEEAEAKTKVPFDLIFTQYIFLSNVNEAVRQKALKVLISTFLQRETLIRELARTDIIVSPQDYRTYINFLSKQRQLKQLTIKLIQDEMFHMIYKKSPGQETNNTKNDIGNILAAISKDVEKADTIEKKRLQHMLRHIGLVGDILNGLMKRLIYKELSYRDLFQTCVDFFYQCCFENPACQQLLLPELNYFLDLLNKQIHTGMLISEIIKSNTDIKYSQNFAKYLINKIINEGYFTSNLIRQLIKLAENNQNATESLDDNVFL